VVQSAEVLYKKPIIVESAAASGGHQSTIDMLNARRPPIRAGTAAQGEEIVVLMEMTLANLTGDGGRDRSQGLSRSRRSAWIASARRSSFPTTPVTSGWPPNLSNYSKKMIGASLWAFPAAQRF